jgi:hypothetical protein
MTLMDFSTAPINAPSSEHEDDLPRIRQYLEDTLETWVPRVLPGAKLNGGNFRAGNLQGQPGNSLVIRLTGSDRGLWIDHATGEKGDVFTLIQSALNTDFLGALEIARDMAHIPMRKVTPAMLKMSDENKERYTREQMGQIIRELWPTIRESPVAHYLHARGLSCIYGSTIYPYADLKYHPQLLHFLTKTKWPSMVALVRDVEGTIIGLHRTYINPTTFNKADVEPNKMMLGKCRGGAVRLAPPTSLLGVSEGIETGLAAMQLTNVPVWAALSTTGMRNIVIPPRINDVVIFADAGRPGEEAAQDLARRLVSENRRARIVRPKYGDDFNDDLRQAGV